MHHPDCPVLYECPITKTLRLKQNGHKFTHNIFKCIFMNENVEFSITISLKFAP